MSPACVCVCVLVVVVLTGLSSWLIFLIILNVSKNCVFFLDFLGPPRGREWAQNVPPVTGSRTPKYRPNPASGGPIGGENTF